jgi:hypothetical protein
MHSPATKTHLWIVFRSFAASFLFVLSVVSGYLIGRSLDLPGENSDSWLLWLVVTTVFLVFGIALAGLAFASVVRFIACGVEHAAELIRDCSPALLTLLLAGLAASQASFRTEHSEGASPASLGIIFGRSSTQENTVLLPFFPIEGTSKACDPNQSNFGNAESLAGSGVEDALRSLAEAIAACSTEARPARIDVRGFASSSEFKGCDKTTSEHLNWLLAERRRQTVIKAIKNKIGSVSIEPSSSADRWSGPEQMRSQMFLSDRNSDESYNLARGSLARRAEIIILSKGACEPKEK